MAKRLLINDFDEDVLAYLGHVRFRRDVAPRGGLPIIYSKFGIMGIQEGRSSCLSALQASN
jgi:hypothetical protein